MASDEQLLSQFIDGDEAAFGQLVMRYEAPLRKLAFGFVRDWAVAEDVAQDAFMRAYRKAASFRQGGQFKAWLYRIAINRARDELRRRKRRREVSWDAESETVREAITEGGSPEVSAVSRELRGRLLSALTALKDDYRTPLVLRDIEGMTYREIAEILGWPLGTVQARIHRGRLALRASLKDYLD